MKEQKIFVFGKSGMLGRYVYSYLKEQGYNVIGVGRKDVDASNYRTMLQKYIQYSMSEGDVVVNCMGTIKPRVDELGDINAIIVNSYFKRIANPRTI